MANRCLFFSILLFCFCLPQYAGAQGIVVTTEGGIDVISTSEEWITVQVLNDMNQVVWQQDINPGSKRTVTVLAGTYTLVEVNAKSFTAEACNITLEPPSGTGGSFGYAHPSPDGVVHVLCPPPPFYQYYYDYHFTYSGHEVTLKAVIWPVEGVNYTYTWHFNDGSPDEVGVLTAGFDQYSVQTTHTFPGGDPVGKAYDCTLTLEGDDGDGPATNPDATGHYRVRMGHAEDWPGIRRMIAIDDGLWYLHKNMTGRVDLTYGDPVPVGKLAANYGSHCQCIEAFQLSGHHASADGATNPYVETVGRAINQLLSSLAARNIMSEPAADTNGNNIGLWCPYDTGSEMYVNGLAMLCLATAQTPFLECPMVKDSTDPNAPYLNGQLYKDILQDYLEYMAWAQVDVSGYYHGGWRYNANDNSSDWSVAQWPALSVFTTQFWALPYKDLAPPDDWNPVLPDFLLNKTEIWISNSQRGDGSFPYTTGSGGMATTGAGIIALDWLLFNGVSDVGGVPIETRIQNAVNWIGNNWYYYNQGVNYAMYAVMKAATLHGAGDESIPQIESFPGSPEHYWDYDSLNPDDGYWKWLINAQQLPDGTWPVSYGYQPIDTGWAICILAGNPIIVDPVAVLDVNPNPTDVDLEVTLDGSLSFDINNPPLPLIEYIFDFGDGSPLYIETADYAPDGAFDGITTHIYDTWTGSHPDYMPGNFASLIVKNELEAESQKDIVEVVVRPPNHQPTPVWTWHAPNPAHPQIPFVFQEVTFDATASFDIDEPLGDEIVLYEWDFDNDGFTDKTGAVATWDFETPGPHTVKLTLTDRDDLWYNSPWPAEDQKTVFVEPLEPESSIYISPREYMSVGHPQLIFVRDRDIVWHNFIINEFEFIFNGKPFGITTLDAFDLEVIQVPGTGEEEETHTIIYFSVRENCMLTTNDGSQFYMKKGDIAELNTCTGDLMRIMKGTEIGVPRVDALCKLIDGRFVFSSSEDFFYYHPVTENQLYIHQNDLVVFDPGTGFVEMYIPGMDIGATTLDAVDEFEGNVYFSVKEPIWIYKPPATDVYLTDGDIGVYTQFRGDVGLHMEGAGTGVATLDALSLGTPIEPINKMPQRPLKQRTVGGSASLNQ